MKYVSAYPSFQLGTFYIWGDSLMVKHHAISPSTVRFSVDLADEAHEDTSSNLVLSTWGIQRKTLWKLPVLRVLGGIF